MLCAKEVGRVQIRQLEESVPVLLCKLEKIFPPGFFNPMEHLMVHLPYQVRVGGPVKYNWMYPIERYTLHPSESFTFVIVLSMAMSYNPFLIGC